MTEFVASTYLKSPLTHWCPFSPSVGGHVIVVAVVVVILNRAAATADHGLAVDECADSSLLKGQLAEVASTKNNVQVTLT